MSSLSRLLYRHFSTALPTTTNTTTIPFKSSVNKLTNLVETFKKSAESYRFRSKTHIYKSTILRLASANWFSSIEEILEDQKKYHDIRKEGFAIRLISLYGKVGMLEHAKKTFDELPELKCERTVKSFNALLTACIESKNYDKVEKLFRELPLKLNVVPDEYSYTIVIQALCEMGNLGNALSLLDEMEGKGVKPNLFTFNVLLHAFYEDGRFLNSEMIWARMEKKQIVPDIRSYNAKLRGLVVAGKIKEAVKLVESLKTKETKPNTISYNALIRGYCNDGKLDEAKRVYDDLLKDELVPNRWTYEILLPAVCEKGDYVYALKLCEKSLENSCRIEAGLVQTVVEGLVKMSKVDEAKNLVSLARHKGEQEQEQEQQKILVHTPAESQEARSPHLLSVATRSES
ncbi:hypothetical protein IFM89_022670 [Coptis chinensis]|uniref:Pentatricopeptide repeat-containing protein n=1 Tax=Coptis chinensis TaxID=261450 RepID=A0A835GXN0_9MAGN|nr:hypothetical protein IFM89_022670 [Coptis chinensis]